MKEIREREEREFQLETNNEFEIAPLREEEYLKFCPIICDNAIGFQFTFIPKWW